MYTRKMNIIVRTLENDDQKRIKNVGIDKRKKVENDWREKRNLTENKKSSIMFLGLRKL